VIWAARGFGGRISGGLFWQNPRPPSPEVSVQASGGGSGRDARGSPTLKIPPPPSKVADAKKEARFGPCGVLQGLISSPARADEQLSGTHRAGPKSVAEEDRKTEGKENKAEKNRHGGNDREMGRKAAKSASGR